MHKKDDLQIPQAFFQHLDIARRAHLGEHVQQFMVDFRHSIADSAAEED